MPIQSPAMFSITTGSSEPIYRQLVEQVRRMAAAGQLAAGDEMPSVRDVAQALAVNPMTVSKAYGLLEMEGVLSRRRGLAMVVAENAPDGASPASRAELLLPTLERVALEARQLELDANTVIALLKKIMKEKR